MRALSAIVSGAVLLFQMSCSAQSGQESSQIDTEMVRGDQTHADEEENLLEISCEGSECTCDPRTQIWDSDSQTCRSHSCKAECGSGKICEEAGGTCVELCAPDRRVGDFEFCALAGEASLGIVVTYVGSEPLDLGASSVRLNGKELDLNALADAQSQTFTIYLGDLSPSKYAFLFRMKTASGLSLTPLFIPTWVGEGTRYGEFTWRDGIAYQVFTDRFLNGNLNNDVDNSASSLSDVLDPRSQWQGGDFAGITEKIRDGYFESLGVNVLWISSPILNSHESQPSVDPGNSERFASYHSYHPIATGYTHLESYGYENPIESAFGTRDELHELINEAHARGIRVIPDFVANHVEAGSNLYKQHPGWFSAYNACHDNWDAARIACWFTRQMPDFDYGSQPEAVQAVVDHALWMIQEFNLDGFRADALKHMDDSAVRALKAAVVEQIETTVNNHALPDEPTIFYMVGESLGGWTRYHVREDMVQGQVDEGFYEATKSALLTYRSSLRDLADFALFNDTAYLRPQQNNGGTGGYPGAVMGTFFGNHDQVRALTEAGGAESANAYKRLRLAQAFLLTSPLNIPMLYQGDDIGTEGGKDPDNRRMQKFDEIQGLSLEERASLEHAQRAGKLREEYAPLRHGTRESVILEDYFWVYKLSYQGEDVYVVLNRDSEKQYTPPTGYVDGLGACKEGRVPSQTACVFVRPRV